MLLLVLLARAYPGSGAGLIDWKPTRSFEQEAQLEVDDVQQMLEAHSLTQHKLEMLREL